MKKIISITLILSALILTSCSGKQTFDNAVISEPAETKAAETAEDANAALIQELNLKIEALESRVTELESKEERLKELEEMFDVEYRDGEYVYREGHGTTQSGEFVRPYIARTHLVPDALP